MLDSPLLPNLLYLILVAGLWLAALSIVTPGTGFYEALAIIALAAAGLGTMIVPVNGWALLPIVIGLGLFAISAWRVRRGVWLLASAIVLTLGSAFLFETESGAPAVDLWLALSTSALSVGFFWLVVRTAVEAQRSAPTHDLSRVLGQVGEVRTAIDPIGSAHISGELWTATAKSEIPVGLSRRENPKRRNGCQRLPDFSVLLAAWDWSGCSFWPVRFALCRNTSGSWSSGWAGRWAKKVLGWCC